MGTLALWVFYGLMVGLTHKLIAPWIDKHNMEGAGWFFALIWPLTLTLGAGAQIGDYAHRRKPSARSEPRPLRRSRDTYRKPSRGEKRRVREVEEATHRKRIAQINAEALYWQEVESGMLKPQPLSLRDKT